MGKVVYNSCYGGFSLSEKAVKLGRKISGDPKWAGAVLPGELYGDGSGRCERDRFDMFHIDYDIPRHDAVLVSVVERLGDAASGAMARLRVEEVDGKYRIYEYDGMETVETPGGYDWKTA